MAAEADYKRLNSDRNLMVLLAPSGNATGVSNIGAPTASELTPGGSTAFINASPSVSWNDYDFGVEDSERTSDPSIADDSNFEDFGQENYGGSMSFYMPDEYDDNSNTHSLVYDLTEDLKTYLDVVTRLDGAKDNMSRAIANGDFVSVFRTVTGSDEDVDTGAEAIRRTRSFISQGAMAPFTIVGSHTITMQNGTNPFTAGKKGRMRGIVQNRDYTNALSFRSSDPGVIQVYPGGFYEITGSAGGTATVYVEDRRAGTSVEVEVTIPGGGGGG